jgi:hypothetical protein
MNESAPRTTLGALLRRAGAELRRQQPPDEVLERVQRSLRAGAWEARHRPLRTAWPRWGVALAGFGGAAAALLALVVLLGAPGQDERAQGLVQVAAAADGFLPLVDAERWRRAAAEGDGRVWLVSTEMSRERLVALGLPYDPARADERVRTQVLMHASGDVLAVRVIR